HALLRPHARGHDAGVRSGVPDDLDQLWDDPRAEAEGTGAGRAAARPRRARRLSVWRRRDDARRAELLLLAGGQAGGLRAAARSQAALTQPQAGLAVVGA